MKKVPLGIAGVAAATVFLALLTSARAQDGTPPPINSRALSATIDYGNDQVFQPGKHNIDFDLYGLDPGQTITLTVSFPVEMAGQAMLAESMDGGTLIIPDGGLFVGTDGTVTFQYQADASQGAYRIAVHQPDDNNYLHFWVVDPNHPENNPPELPGAY